MYCSGARWLWCESDYDSDIMSVGGSGKRYMIRNIQENDGDDIRYRLGRCIVVGRGGCGHGAIQMMIVI